MVDKKLSIKTIVKNLKDVAKKHINESLSKVKKINESYKDDLKATINDLESALRAPKTSPKYSDLIANYTTIENARKELKELKKRYNDLTSKKESLKVNEALINESNKVLSIDELRAALEKGEEVKLGSTDDYADSYFGADFDNGGRFSDGGTYSDTEYVAYLDNGKYVLRADDYSADGDSKSHDSFGEYGEKTYDTLEELINELKTLNLDECNIELPLEEGLWSFIKDKAEDLANGRAGKTVDKIFDFYAKKDAGKNDATRGVYTIIVINNRDKDGLNKAVNNKATWKKCNDYYDAITYAINGSKGGGDLHGTHALIMKPQNGGLNEFDSNKVLVQVVNGKVTETSKNNMQKLEDEYNKDFKQFKDHKKITKKMNKVKFVSDEEAQDNAAANDEMKLNTADDSTASKELSADKLSAANPTGKAKVATAKKSKVSNSKPNMQMADSLETPADKKLSENLSQLKEDDDLLNISDDEFNRTIEKFGSSDDITETEVQDNIDQINETIDDKEEYSDVDINDIDDIEDIDEESLESCLKESLTNVYENVKDFRLFNCKTDDNSNLIVEGAIKFNSNKIKDTTFVFDNIKRNNAEGQDSRFKLHGFNESLNVELNANALNDTKKLYFEEVSYKYNFNGTLVEGLGHRH